MPKEAAKGGQDVDKKAKLAMRSCLADGDTERATLGPGTNDKSSTVARRQRVGSEQFVRPCCARVAVLLDHDAKSTQLSSCSLACETVAIHQPLPPRCAVVQSTHLVLTSTSNQTLEDFNLFSCPAPDLTLTASRYHLAPCRCCPGVSTTTLHTSL
jgi:hypothetical protein